jgi:hypothetical protein
MPCRTEQNFSSPKCGVFPLNHFKLNGVTKQANANKLRRNKVECEYNIVQEIISPTYKAQQLFASSKYTIK